MIRKLLSWGKFTRMFAYKTVIVCSMTRPWRCQRPRRTFSTYGRIVRAIREISTGRTVICLWLSNRAKHTQAFVTRASSETKPIKWWTHRKALASCQESTILLCLSAINLERILRPTLSLNSVIILVGISSIPAKHIGTHTTQYIEIAVWCATSRPSNLILRST